MPAHIGTFGMRREIALNKPVIPTVQNPSAPLEAYTSQQKISEPYSPGSARYRFLEQAYLARK